MSEFVSDLPVSGGHVVLGGQDCFLESVLVSGLPVFGGHVVLGGQDCC